MTAHISLELDFLKTQVAEAKEQLNFAIQRNDPGQIRSWQQSLAFYEKRFQELTRPLPPEEASCLHKEIFGEESLASQIATFTDKVRQSANRAMRAFTSTAITSWKLREYQAELTVLEDNFRTLVSQLDPGEANVLYQQVFEAYKRPLDEATAWARIELKQFNGEEFGASLGQESVIQQAFKRLISLQSLVQQRRRNQ